MKRTRIQPEPDRFPAQFHSLLSSAPVYDSSCSTDARVYFIDRDEGLYLKSAPAGSLAPEAEMTRYFHDKGLAARVLGYVSEDRDWLLTARVPGEDCTHPQYLSDPERLCDTLARQLRMLHDLDSGHCPVTDRNRVYMETADRNYRAGKFDADLFPPGWSFPSAEEARRMIEDNAKHLKSDALLHGDYCLPNIMLEDWRFTGFIDLGRAGLGDRHIDIFWGLWTLNYNLKTNAYYDRFLDAYGRDKVEPEMLRLVAALEMFL